MQRDFWCWSRSASASVLLVNKARDDSGWVVHTVEVENQINTLLLEIRRAESAARGYLLTSGPEFLADHETAVAHIIPDSTSSPDLTSDNPVQVENIRKLRARSRTRLGQFAQEMEFVKQDEPDDAIALVREAAAGDTTVDDPRRRPTRCTPRKSGCSRMRTANADRSQKLASIRDDRRLRPRDRARRHFDLPGAALSRAPATRPKRRLRDNNLNLEATVDERTADLREANDEIQRFAYIVSHDLRSPLVNIMGFTSELEELRGDIFKRIAALARPQSPRRDAGQRDRYRRARARRRRQAALGRISPKRSASSNPRSPRWTG